MAEHAYIGANTTQQRKTAREMALVVFEDIMHVKMKEAPDRSQLDDVGKKAVKRISGFGNDRSLHVAELVHVSRRHGEYAEPNGFINPRISIQYSEQVESRPILFFHYNIG